MTLSRFGSAISVGGSAWTLLGFRAGYELRVGQYRLRYAGSRRRRPVDKRKGSCYKEGCFERDGPIV